MPCLKIRAGAIELYYARVYFPTRIFKLSFRYYDNSSPQLVLPQTLTRTTARHHIPFSPDIQFHNTDSHQVGRVPLGSVFEFLTSTNIKVQSQLYSGAAV